MRGGVIARALAFVRFSHTVFALPFALGAMFAAARGWPGWEICGLIVLAMVFARTAAMAFNRLADWDIDRRNPRTEGRHRLLPRPVASGLLVASAAAFVAVTAFINPVCFALSPVALALVFFYSLTKRFTSFTHFFLGLALAASPVGAWLAVRPEWAFAPFVLALAVLLWVAGFDLIYATQDYDFDRTAGLRSLVVRIGIEKSLRLAPWLHAGMFALLIAFGILVPLGTIYFVSLVPVFAALVYEHRIARRGDLAAINAAFFQCNTFVGFVFVLGVALDRCL